MRTPRAAALITRVRKTRQRKKRLDRVQIPVRRQNVFGNQNCNLITIARIQRAQPHHGRDTSAVVAGPAETQPGQVDVTPAQDPGLAVAGVLAPVRFVRPQPPVLAHGPHQHVGRGGTVRRGGRRPAAAPGPLVQLVPAGVTQTVGAGLGVLQHPARVRSARLALAGAAAAIAAMYAVFVLFPTAWPFPAPLVRVSAEFLAGCLLCVAYRHGFGRTWRWPTVAPVALLAAVLAGTWLEATGRQAIWAVPALAVVILALARAERGILQRWLASRHMVYLGQISYALYMTHAICQLVLDHLVPPTAQHAGLAGRTAIVIAYVGTPFAAAALVYRFVEEPSRRWMRRHVPTGARSKGDGRQPDRGKG